MRSLSTCIAAAAVALASPAAAQDTPAGNEFSISGTSRLRYEAIDGQARVGFNKADDLVNLCTTLLAEYRDGAIRIAGELWDSRVYGGDRRTPITTGEVNPIELVQAFVEVKPKDPFGAATSASLQAGRFLLNLGSRRLVAADDYRNTTNGYTGLRADLGGRGGWKATAIYVLPQQRRPDSATELRHNHVALDREGLDLVLWGGLASRTRAIGGAMMEASFFHLGERDRPLRATRDRSLNTAAVRLMTDPAAGNVDFEIEGAIQRGRISTGTTANASRQRVAAWFIHADAGYTFTSPRAPRVSIEYDHASGDGAGGHYGRFDTLFGMRRTDLAPAGLHNAILRSNIISIGPRIEAAPSKRTDLMTTIHYMWLAAREDTFSSTGVRDPSARSGRYAGTQLDGRVRHLAIPWLRLEADAVLLAKGRFLRDAPNAPPGRWTRYVSVNATATF